MDFFAFDKAYVQRLRDGDPATEHHFFVYFDKLLQIKLRARAVESDKVEDLKQDTFIRVIAAVRKEGGVRQPERFGSFVNSVCNNVLLEYYRSLWKNQRMDETPEEIPSKALDLDVDDGVQAVLGTGAGDPVGAAGAGPRLASGAFLGGKGQRCGV